MKDYAWDWGRYALDAEAEKRFVAHNHEDLLKICDVDMTTKEPVEEALKVFENTLKEFSKII